MEPYYQFYLADGKKMIKGVGYKDSKQDEK